MKRREEGESEREQSVLNRGRAGRIDARFSISWGGKHGNEARGSSIDEDKAQTSKYIYIYFFFLRFPFDNFVPLDLFVFTLDSRSRVEILPEHRLRKNIVSGPLLRDRSLCTGCA